MKIQSLQPVLGALLLASLPAALSAQDTEARVRLGVAGGFSVPVGDLGDAFDTGFNVTGHVWYTPIGKFGLRGDLSLDRNNATSEIPLTNATQTGHLTAIGGSANLLYNFPRSESAGIVRPYVLGGLGLYHTRTEVTLRVGATETVTENNDTNLGLQLGGGVDFLLAGITTFAEVRFINAFVDNGNARWLPVTFGIRF